MNEHRFLESVDLYKKYLSNPTQDAPDEQVRRERIAFYQEYDKEKILSMTEDDFESYIGKLWASSTFGNKTYIVNQMIEANSGFAALKNKLVELLYGNKPIEQRWDQFLKNTKHFGPSYISELLTYIKPDQYAIANRVVIQALTYLGIPSLPKYNYHFTGKKYAEICAIFIDIQKRLQKHSIEVNDLLSVDYFLWEVANSERVTKEAEIEVVKPIEKDDQMVLQNEFVHNEIIEKIVNIGTILGFKASSEKKVAQGAVVDAVWEVNIGNMGKVMYVFEVQSKGSIDSLILNLQKAGTNKAVQALVAVSDKNGLEKIKHEVDPIKDWVKIIFWDYNDVISVYNCLDQAFQSINRLGLVPEGF